jgi:hypothetical protein
VSDEKPPLAAPGASHPPVPLQLKRGGGDAYIVEHKADFVTLASSAPSPPGSTVEATHAAGERSVTVRVKVRGCRRHPLPDGRDGFCIDGRFVSLTRADREILFGSQFESQSRSTSET